MGEGGEDGGRERQGEGQGEEDREEDEEKEAEAGWVRGRAPRPEPSQNAANPDPSISQGKVKPGRTPMQERPETFGRLLSTRGLVRNLCVCLHLYIHIYLGIRPSFLKTIS